MASPNNYSGGIGGSSGDELATAPTLQMSGTTWYVSSLTGANAASPAGKDRIKPLATLAQAVTNSAAGDIICLLSGHTETLTASQTISKAGLSIISEGAAGSTNAARFTCNGAVVMLDITAAGVWLGGIYFAASSTAPTPARVRIAGASSMVRGCYFECGASDTVPALQYVTGAGTATVRDTTFVSTATLVTAQPHSAINVLNAMSDLTLERVTFSGGVTGWSNQFAFDAAAAVTRLTVTATDLLLDSDMTVATASVYKVGIRNKSGSARVVLTA